MARIRTHVLGDPSDPRAHVVPLYHCLTYNPQPHKNNFLTNNWRQLSYASAVVVSKETNRIPQHIHKVLEPQANCPEFQDVDMERLLLAVPEATYRVLKERSPLTLRSKHL
ncbi:hypothetical protein E2C01_012653 [Portunus trituberculatus]|uniref:Uncharacterized protein n=1 Tax=Portunus trituberculatus TaxID=210409 RepID=A0A5B7DET6_PORTR|nr:hypothetical protein [Portunus trituberculatus]